MADEYLIHGGGISTTDFTTATMYFPGIGFPPSQQALHKDMSNKLHPSLQSKELCCSAAACFNRLQILAGDGS